MPDYVGIPPFDECKELLRLQLSKSKQDQLKLDLHLLLLYNQGYRVDQLAFVLGKHVNAVYRRLATARRVGTDNPPVGDPNYRSPISKQLPSKAELNPDAAERLRYLHEIAVKPKPSPRDGFMAYDLWFNARREFQEMVYNAIEEQGIEKRRLSYYTRGSVAFITRMLNEYKRINRLET